jgi:hypothetical protein
MREAMDPGELEGRLRDLGPLLAVPPPEVAGVELAAAVRARLLAQPPRANVRLGVARLVRRPPDRPVVRAGASEGWRRAVAVAAAVAVLAAGVVVFSPAAREAVAGWLGLGGVKITRVPHLPTPPSGTTFGQNLELGAPVSLQAARERSAWSVLVPHDPRLVEASVFLNQSLSGGQVSFVYRAGPGLPETSATGVGLLLTEFQATADEAFIEKLLGAGSIVKAVTVDGRPGFWVTGAVHQILYLAPDGSVVPDSIRLAGNTLLWQDGSVTLRIESSLSEAEAIRIASTVR